MKLTKAESRVLALIKSAKPGEKIQWGQLQEEVNLPVVISFLKTMGYLDWQGCPTNKVELAR